jgi:hypothetical protein
MRDYCEPDVRHALEVLGRATLGVRLEVACMLIREGVIDPSVGIAGRGFLREAESGLQAVLDWIAVGSRDAPKAINLEDRYVSEASLD